MRGSTPLDVAAASCIDNNELALALQEQDLEMVRHCITDMLSNAFIYCFKKHLQYNHFEMSLPLCSVGCDIPGWMWLEELSHVVV